MPSLRLKSAKWRRKQKFPPLQAGPKAHQKSALLRQKKKNKTPNLTMRSKSGVLAHSPIILVLMVLDLYYPLVY